MQKKVQIISDGSQDLSPELSKEKDIEVVPFYVSFDGEHYYKEIGSNFLHIIFTFIAA